MEKKSCELVQDLIIVYRENLTCEKTNYEMEQHLNECKFCKEKYSELADVKEVEGNHMDKINMVKMKIRYILYPAIGLGVILTIIKIFLAEKANLFPSELSEIIFYILNIVGITITPILILALSFLWKMCVDFKKNKIIQDMLIIFFITLISSDSLITIVKLIKIF